MIGLIERGFKSRAEYCRQRIWRDPISLSMVDLASFSEHKESGRRMSDERRR